MKKFKIKVTKKYSFTLEGDTKEDINNQVNNIINETRILDLPYVRKNISVKIKELRKDRNKLDEENN